MKDVELTDTGSLSALVVNGFDSAQVVDQGKRVAVVLSAARMDAIEATLAVLATNGAIAAIAEGLADLDAGRFDAWQVLRADYGRTDDEISAGPRVSHRARWDLELLPPDVAEHCFDALETMTDSSVRERGVQMCAAFGQLEIIAAHGYRMLVRAAVTGPEIVHVDRAET